MMNVRLKKFILLFSFTLILGLLLLGAVNVTLSRNSQIRHAEQAMEKARSWHTQISTEVPLAQKQSWSNLGHEYPLQLLAICTIEKKDEALKTVPKN